MTVKPEAFAILIISLKGVIIPKVFEVKVKEKILVFSEIRVNKSLGSRRP
jgi:hypothetical protein